MRLTGFIKYGYLVDTMLPTLWLLVMCVWD